MTKAIDYYLAELEDLYRNSGKLLGVGNKIMVEADRLEAIASGLRKTIPDDVLEASEVIKQRDSIINQAYLESKRVRESAKKESNELAEAARNQHDELVSESEVLKVATSQAEAINDEAHCKASEILRDARQSAVQITGAAEVEAKERRHGADQYSREVLFSIEERLSQMLGQVRRGIDALGTDSDSMVKVAAGPATNGKSSS